MDHFEIFVTIALKGA